VAGRMPATAEPAGSSPTVVLVNESYLRRKYSAEAPSLLASARAFAEQQNGALIDTGQQTDARAIKALLARYPRRPRRLVILGDEAGIPRFAVKAPGVNIHIDSFYGDLDGDGWNEIAVTRVLGTPQAMARQLGGSAASGASPHAMFLASDPRLDVQGNRFAALMGDLGCTYEVCNPGDPAALAHADVIIVGGHGNPNGWYGAGGTYVTAATVPDLPRQPVIFVGACSTATPGAPILQKFLDKGCRAYIGAVSDSYGWTPGNLGNQLTMHFIDALTAFPNWPVAELVTEARNRYVRANNLQKLVLSLERGESPNLNVVVTQTALQWQMFGDVTARFPRSAPLPAFRKYPAVTVPRLFMSGVSISFRYSLNAGGGLPLLFLQASWDKEVSARLQAEVLQNGALLHKIDWREQREFWAYADTSVGGYWDRGRYYAFACLPLVRHEGDNEAIVRVVDASRPIQLLASSAVQVWPRRQAPAPAAQRARQKRLSLLWLTRDEDLTPMRGALAMVSGLQFDRRFEFGNMLAPYEFPDQLDQQVDLTRYNVVLIDDLDNGYRRFPRGAATRLREFVRGGGGLIMAGGPWSFSGKPGYKGGGQGGYGGTPVEEALPVRTFGDSDWVEGKTAVRIVDARHLLTADLDWRSLPAVIGYNRVSAKAGADVLARTAAGDPLVAAWHYGKGRAAAVTIRPARGGSSEFKQWKDYRRFWKNAILWAAAAPDLPIDLSGVWRASDGGTYTVTQSGSQITCEGVSADGGKRWTNSFNGTLKGDRISGTYFDHPPGAARGRAELSIRIVHGGLLEKVPGTGGDFGSNVWIRDISGVWHCDDGGTYTVEQSGLEITWEGVSPDGGKRWTHTFNGALRGDYIAGKYSNHPPGASRGSGDLSILIVDGGRFERVQGTGGNFGGNVWTRQ
jgi:uncharacterized membrane protein